MIEAHNSQLRATVRRVSRFTTGDQALRWAVVAGLRAEPRLYRMAGYRYLPLLAEALEVYVHRLEDVTTQAS